MKKMKLTTIIPALFVLVLPVMATAFPTSFWWSNVWYENRDYDDTKYSLPDYKAILADVVLEDTGDYNKDTINIYLLGSPGSYKLNWVGTWNIGGKFYHEYVRRIDTLNPSFWGYKNYFFTIDGYPPLGNNTQVILHGLRELPLVTPVTISGNTISWTPVIPSQDAFINYRLRVHALDLAGNPVGIPIFETPAMTATSFTFSLPLPSPLIVGKEYGLRLEAREFFNYYGTADFLNRSTYFTKFTPVPIPPTFLLLGAGLVGLAGLGRLRRK